MKRKADQPQQPQHTTTPPTSVSWWLTTPRTEFQRRAEAERERMNRTFYKRSHMGDTNDESD